MLTASLAAAQTSPQPIECTNCSDLTGWVGIILAGVATIVALWSLYATALRRPKIEVEHVPYDPEIGWPGWQGALPSKPKVFLKIVMVNTGASTTYAREARLSDQVRYEGRGRAPFESLRYEQRIGLPYVFERGDAQWFQLEAELQWAEGFGNTGYDVADAVRDLDRLTVRFEWTYRTSPRFVPWRRTTVSEHVEIALDTRHLREHAIAHWRHYAEHDADYARLVEIAEGGNTEGTTPPEPT